MIGYKVKTKPGFSVRSLPSSVLNTAQPELTDILIDRGDDNPSKAVVASCLSGGLLAGIGFFRDP